MWTRLVQGVLTVASLALTFTALFWVTTSYNEETMAHLLFVYGAMLLPLLLALGMVIARYVWHQKNIEFETLFHWQPEHAINDDVALTVVLCLVLSWSIAFFLSFHPELRGEIFANVLPLILIGFWMVVFLLPLPIFWHKTLLYFLKETGRILTFGLRPVRLVDTFLVDLTASLSFAFAGVYVGACLYADALGYSGAMQSEQCLPSKSWLPTLLISVPYLLRCAQCTRRAIDDKSKRKSQIVNLVKYTFALLVVWTSAISGVGGVTQVFYIYVLVAIMSTIYSSTWDIYMDWGIHSREAILEQNRRFPTWFYYTAIVYNVIGRVAWILTLSASFILLYGVYSFILGVIEVSRRAIWAILKVEHEWMCHENRDMDELDDAELNCVDENISEMGV